MKILDIKIENLFGDTIEKRYHFHLSAEELEALKLDETSLNKAAAVFQKEMKKLEKEGIADTAKFDDLSKASQEALTVFYNLMETQLIAAYGEPSEDGLRFIKDEKLTAEFKDSIVVDQIMNNLMGMGEDMIYFFAGIYPKAQEKAFLEAMEAKKGPVLEGHKEPKTKTVKRKKS